MTQAQRSYKNFGSKGYLHRAIYASLFFTFYFLSFNFAFSATVPAGVLKDQMWFSKDPFFVDDTITIFTLVYNSSDYRLSGTMQLRDGTTTIDKKTFTVLPAGGSLVVSFPWRVTAGNHNFSAVILENELVKIAGGVVDSSIATTETLSIKRFADLDTDGDGIGNTTDADDDNDGIGDIEEKKNRTDPLSVDTDGDNIPDKSDLHPLIKDVPEKASSTPPTPNPIDVLEASINSNVPEPIASRAIPVLGSIEDFRIRQAKSANSGVLKATKEIVIKENATSSSEGVRVLTAKSPAWSIFNEGVKSGNAMKTPFEYAKLFFALIWQFLMTNVYAFYVLILLILYKVIRLILKLFF